MSSAEVGAELDFFLGGWGGMGIPRFVPCRLGTRGKASAHQTRKRAKDQATDKSHEKII
jgi:hypothetical protein